MATFWYNFLFYCTCQTPAQHHDIKKYINNNFNSVISLTYGCTFLWSNSIKYDDNFTPRHFMWHRKVSGFAVHSKTANSTKFYFTANTCANVQILSYCQIHAVFLSDFSFLHSFGYLKTKTLYVMRAAVSVYMH